jgi:hypothetical protein
VALSVLAVVVAAGALGLYVLYGVRLMRRSGQEKVAVLERLRGKTCVLEVAKGAGHSQLVVEVQCVIREVSKRHVEVENDGTARTFALGEVRRVATPTGEVIGDWGGGHFLDDADDS